MEVDVFFYPSDVGVAGAGGVVFELDGVAVLVEEFFALRFFGRFGEGGCFFGGWMGNWGFHFVAFGRGRLYNPGG